MSSGGSVYKESIHVHLKRIVLAMITRNEEQELRQSKYNERVDFEVGVEEEEECKSSMKRK